MRTAGCGKGSPQPAVRSPQSAAVYYTCSFCHQALGANAEVEAFPGGRRLAFAQDPLGHHERHGDHPAGLPAQTRQDGVKGKAPVERRHAPRSPVSLGLASGQGLLD